MWRDIRNGLIGALLLAACIALCSIGAFFLRASVLVDDTHNLLRDADAVAVQARTIPPVANAAIALSALSLAGTADSATTTLTSANRILAANEPVIAKALLHIDKAAGESANASKQTYKASLQLAQASEKAVVLVDNANLLITQTTRVAGDAGKLVSNPAIARTLDSLDQASAHIDRTSATVEKYVNRITKPASVLKRVATETLRLAAIVAKAFIP